MTRSDGTRPDEAHDVGLDVIEYALGHGDQVDRERFRASFEADLGLALELAEVRDLFESCRTVGCEPTGRVAQTVRAAVARRVRLRRVGPRGVGRARLERVGVDVLRIAAVAVLALSAAVWGRSWFEGRVDGAGIGRSADSVAMIEGLDRRAPAAPREGSLPVDAFASLLAADRLPVVDPVFAARAARFAERPIPDEFRGLLSAENRLARLRAEAELRFSSEARASLRRKTGVPDMDARIGAVAREVAREVPQVAAEVQAGSDPLDLTFALRALVAAGSGTGSGPHAAEVALARDGLFAFLESGAPRRGGDLPGRRVSALCALAELAVLGDRESIDRVARAADEIAAGILGSAASAEDERVAARPELLSFGTPLHALADAGRLLWIAPAFGAHPGLALRARMMVAAHVEERLVQGAGAEQPARLAALLYGFGDLVDRDAVERALALWRPRLLRDDLVAVHHLAWSRYPVRAGWADFQRELRWLSGLPSPESLRGRAALLLGLCTNVAAPGVGGLLDA